MHPVIQAAVRQGGGGADTVVVSATTTTPPVVVWAPGAPPAGFANRLLPPPRCRGLRDSGDGQAADGEGSAAWERRRCWTAIRGSTTRLRCWSRSPSRRSTWSG